MVDAERRDQEKVDTVEVKWDGPVVRWGNGRVNRWGDRHDLAWSDGHVVEGWSNGNESEDEFLDGAHVGDEHPLAWEVVPPKRKRRSGKQN